jgi:hypothetical protein
MEHKVDSSKQMRLQIEELRQQMADKANEKKGNLCHPDVVDISEQLNKLLVKYQKHVQHHPKRHQNR